MKNVSFWLIFTIACQLALSLVLLLSTSNSVQFESILLDSFASSFIQMTLTMSHGDPVLNNFAPDANATSIPFRSRYITVTFQEEQLHLRRFSIITLEHYQSPNITIVSNRLERIHSIRAGLKFATGCWMRIILPCSDLHLWKSLRTEGIQTLHLEAFSWPKSVCSRPSYIYCKFLRERVPALNVNPAHTIYSSLHHSLTK